jgi:hypothetical protein
MSDNEKEIFQLSREVREDYWNELIGECLKRQQLDILSLVEKINNVYHDLQLSAEKNHRLLAMVGIESHEAVTIFRPESTKADIMSLVESIHLVSSAEIAEDNQVHIGCGLGKECNAAKVSPTSILSSSQVSGPIPSSLLPPQQQEPVMGSVMDAHPIVNVTETIPAKGREIRQSLLEVGHKSVGKMTTKVEPASSVRKINSQTTASLFVEVQDRIAKNILALGEHMSRSVENDVNRSVATRIESLKNSVASMSKFALQNVPLDEPKSMQQLKSFVNVAIDNLALCQREEIIRFRQTRSRYEATMSVSTALTEIVEKCVDSTATIQQLIRESIQDLRTMVTIAKQNVDAEEV